MSTLVMKTAEASHAWVHRDADIVNNHGGTFSGNTTSVCSYALTIAARVPNSSRVITLSPAEGGYSITTAKHVSHINSAVPDYLRLPIYMNSVDEYVIRRGAYLPKEPKVVRDSWINQTLSYHESVLNAYIDHVQTCLAKLPRARSNKAFYAADAKETLVYAKRYIETFSLDELHRRSDTRTARDIVRMVDELDLMLGADEYKATADTINTAMEKAAGRHISDYKKKLRNFRNFKSNSVVRQVVYVNKHSLWLGPQALRYNIKRDMVETSGGSTMSPLLVVKAYGEYKRTGKLPEDVIKYRMIWSKRGKPNAKLVEIGCHTIALKEIERVVADIKSNRESKKENRDGDNN